MSRPIIPDSAVVDSAITLRKIVQTLPDADLRPLAHELRLVVLIVIGASVLLAVLPLAMAAIAWIIARNRRW